MREWCKRAHPSVRTRCTLQPFRRIDSFFPIPNLSLLVLLHGGLHFNLDYTTHYGLFPPNEAVYTVSRGCQFCSKSWLIK